MAYSASVFPSSNLSPQSQQWRAAVEKRMSILEEGDTSVQARRIMSRWTAAIGALGSMEDRIDDAQTLASAANAMADDAVSWHEVPPVSPGEGILVADIPVN